MADIKQKLKQFKKELKNFKSLAQKDKYKSVELSEKLIVDCDIFITSTELGLDESQKKMFIKTKESLTLYNQQIKSLKEFEEKWK